MISCKNCDRLNTLDGNFCRGCGHALDADQLQEARTKNLALLADGFKLLSETRYEEALMVADNVLETDPTVTQGHSLRGDCLERRGDLIGALAAYERVLALEPSSTLDRIKLTHLQNVMAERTALAPKPNRRAAVLAGVAATVLVAALGSAAALYVQQRSASPTNQNDSVGIVADNRNVGMSNSTEIPLPQQPKTGIEAAGEQKAPTQAPEKSDRKEAEPEREAIEAPSRSRNEARLPEARGNGSSRPMTGEIEPLRPGDINIQPIQPTTPQPTPRTAPSKPSIDPDPSPVGGSGPTTKPAPVEDNKPKPVIDIRPSPNNPSRTGGSQVLPEATPSGWREWTKRGQEAFIRGDYSEAVSAYQRALSSGADSGITNQRIGQCFERLGKKAEAVQAYQRAAATYERRVKSGNASEADKNGLDICNRAIANLQ